MRYKIGLGVGTNTFFELITLNILLKCAFDKGLITHQVVRDFDLVINWMNERYKMENLGLTILFDQLKKMKPIFNDISFAHIYREHNTLMNSLSQEGLQDKEGKFMLRENKDKVFMLETIFSLFDASTIFHI